MSKFSLKILYIVFSAVCDIKTITISFVWIVIFIDWEKYRASDTRCICKVLTTLFFILSFFRTPSRSRCDKIDYEIRRYVILKIVASI